MTALDIVQGDLFNPVAQKPKKIEPSTQAPVEIRLRDYQVKVIQDIYDKIRQGHKRICLILTAGAGKTYTSASIMKDAVAAGKKCVFLVTLNVLLNQTEKSIKNLGLECSVLQGKRKVNKNSKIIVASLQTIDAKLRQGLSLYDILGRPDVVIADEAHVSAFHKAYDQIDTVYPYAIKIGLTATPWRLAKDEYLGLKYETSVEGPQPYELVKRGAVLWATILAPGGVFDIESLKEVGGDYSGDSISKQATREDALRYQYDQWKQHAYGRPTMMVGATVHQVKVTCEFFNKMGVVSEYITGSTPEKERLAIFERVRTGHTALIGSVGCISYGFDLPPISCILYSRVTKSKTLFHQTACRGSRPYEGKKDFIILDFGDNAKGQKHGNPMGYQDYYIGPKNHEPGEVPMKECPNCGHMQLCFNVKCEKCGYEFTSPDDGQEELMQFQELTEYFDSYSKRMVKDIRSWRKQAFRDYVDSGYKISDKTSPDWPVERFIAEYGMHPRDAWMVNAVLTKRYSKKKLAEYIRYLKAHIKNERYASQWLNHHYKLETGEDYNSQQESIL